MMSLIRIWLKRPEISVFLDITCRFVTSFTTYSLTYIYLYLLLHLPLFTNLTLLRPYVPQHTQKHWYYQFSTILVQSNRIFFSFSNKTQRFFRNFISTIQKSLLKVHRQKQPHYISSSSLLFLILCLTCFRIFWGIRIKRSIVSDVTFYTLFKNNFIISIQNTLIIFMQPSKLKLIKINSIVLKNTEFSFETTLF